MLGRCSARYRGIITDRKSTEKGIISEKEGYELGHMPTSKPPTSTAVRLSNAASPRARGTTMPSGVTKSMPTEMGRAKWLEAFGRREILREG